MKLYIPRPGEGISNIDHFRKKEGLPPIVKGKTECLKCGSVFKSRDVKKNRMCEACRSVASRISESHRILLD